MIVAVRSNGSRLAKKLHEITIVRNTIIVITSVDAKHHGASLSEG